MGIGDMDYNAVANGNILRKKKLEVVPAGIASAPAIAAQQSTNQPAAAPGGISIGAGKPPTIYGNGGLPAPVVEQGIATMRNQMAQPQTGGGWSLGSGQKPTIYGNGGLSAPVVQQGIDKMRPQLSAVPAPAAQQPTDPNPEPAQMVIDGVKYGPAPTKTLNPLTAMAQGFGATASMVGNAVTPAPFDNRAAARLEANRAGLNAEAAPATAPSAAPGAPVMAGNTASAVDPRAQHQAILNGSQSVADQSAIDALKPKPGIDEGILRVTEMPAGSRAPMGSGFDSADRRLGGRDISKQKLFTNVGGDGTAGMSAAGGITQGIAAPSVGNPNLGTADDNMRQIANIRALNDTTPQGGMSILGDGGIEEANAEKTARWRQDDLVEKASRGNQAAVGAAINANASTSNAMTAANASANAEAGRQGIAARGQDMAAKSEAARLAGNPNDNALKQAQAQGIAATTDSSRMIADIQKRAMAGDAQAMAVYQSLTGKKSDTNLREQFMETGGGQEWDEKAGAMRNVPKRLVDLRTGQEVAPPGAAKQTGPSQADLEHTAKKHGMTVEQVKAKLAQQQGAK